MKFNWGTGIFIFLVVFVLSMMGLVYITSIHEVNLVTQEYYPKGVKYQDQIDKEKHTSALVQELEVMQEGNIINITFPNIYNGDSTVNDIQGNIQLYFPVSYRYDKKYKISVDANNIHSIPTDSVMVGRCIIKVDWTANGIDYYQETELRLK